MTDRYVDPNSGAAPQPGGYAHSPVELPDEEKPDTEERDATYDAAVEHEAAPQGDQPAPQNDGESANEAGQTEDDATTEGGAPAEEGSAEQEAAEEETTEEAPDAGAGDSTEEEPAKDYSELLASTVPEIQEYLAAHPDEVDAVKAAEIDLAGDDARKGVINYGD